MGLCLHRKEFQGNDNVGTCSADANNSPSKKWKDTARACTVNSC